MVRKYLMLSVVAALSLTNAYGADSVETMFSEGKASGQVRLFLIDREYEGSAGNRIHRDANAVGGYLKYETAPLAGFSLGAAFYTTQGFLNHSPKSDTTEVDPTLLGKNNDSYSLLGEAYIGYKNGNTAFKGGRQKLSTPMIADDDARMVPNLFEAYMLTNKDVANTTIVLGHVSKMAQGTFGKAYGTGGILGVTSGYSSWDATNGVGQFTNMGTYAFNKSTDGVTLASVTYTGVQNLKLEVWDYYAHDIMNTIYAEGAYSWKCAFNDALKPYGALQLIKQNSFGSEYGGELEGLYVGGKFGLKVDSFDFSLAYSQTDENSVAEKNSGARANAIVTPWGGMPAYTQGMVTRHQFLAGTKAAKATGSYNFKDLGLTTALYYAEFEIDENSGYGVERTASEAGFDAIYNPKMVKNLQLRLRGNFPRSFAESAAGTTGWNEYRFIANYNF